MKKYLNQRIATTDKNVDEKYLFCCIADYFNVVGCKSTFVEKVHQFYIKYPSIFAGTLKKIEIADLQIVNHDISTNQTRLCFIQAKYKREQPRMLLDFEGNAFQWELLRNRPNIIDEYNNGFPEDILSFTNYKSISSFGIFYKDSEGKIDFLFSIPEKIEISQEKRKTSMNYSKYRIPGSINTIIKDEAYAIFSINEFGNLIQRN